MPERPARPAKSRRKAAIAPRPTDGRPAGDVQWLFGFGFSARLDPAIATRLKDFVGGFAEVSAEGSTGENWVVADAQPKDFWKAYAGRHEVLTADQMAREGLLDAPRDERMAALREALAAPGWLNWQRVAMLLGSWPAAQDPGGALDEAERALAAWPDATRSAVAAFLRRLDAGDATLHRRLVRKLGTGSLATELARHSLDAVTSLYTHDVPGLEAAQHRLSHLRELSIGGRAEAHTMLLRCPALTGLRRLALSFPRYTGARCAPDLAALLAAPHLAHLNALALEGYDLPAASLAAFLEGPQRLEHLRLQNASIEGAAGGAGLAGLAERHPLRSLELNDNALGPAGLRSLMASRGLDALHTLDLASTVPGDDGALALAANPRLGALRWLNLSTTDLEGALHDDAAVGLARSTTLGSLETLIVNGQPLGAEGLAALLGSTSLRSLRALAAFCPAARWDELLDRCGRGEPAALERLDLSSLNGGARAGDWSRATFLRGVRHLRVEALPGAEYAGLFGCGHLARAEVVILGGCFVEADAALEGLLRAPPLPALRFLSMTGWRMGAEQAAALARSPLVQSLRGVNLSPSHVGEKVARAFLDAGVALVSTRAYPERAVDEQRHWDHTFRDAP
ncbi:MAG: hypothetical protein JWM10_41 [Myxococcaceae bacterium]|nr:hypothetical protein [Myxococcaceae bacterium]